MRLNERVQQSIEDALTWKVEDAIKWTKDSQFYDKIMEKWINLFFIKFHENLALQTS